MIVGGDKLQRLKNFPERLIRSKNQAVYQLAGIVMYKGTYNLKQAIT